MDTEIYKGYTIEILQDENPQNPRTEFDNASTMICFHKRYILGDKHEIKHQDYNAWEGMERAINKKYKPVIIKPLFLLDHSGISISTNNPNDKWDSMRIGFLLMSRKNLLECYGVKRITTEIKKKAENLLDAEVETYDQYLRGDVYGYVVRDSDGEEVDSCWGYYGYDHEQSGLKEAARNIIDCELKNERV
jgi:hypothetical protein